MKSIFIVFLGLVLFSCRKDYTCVCTADDEEFNITQTLTMTETAAEGWCDEMHQDNKFDGEEIEGWKCILEN